MKEGSKAKAAAARTAFLDALGPWYSLDNAASIMPSVSNQKRTNLFGFAATFHEEIDRATLRQALDATLARFPYFNVELRRGLFHEYLVPRSDPMPLSPYSPQAPLIDYDVNKRGHAVMRVCTEGRKLRCEFHHSLTDGTGGMRFFKNFIVEYLRIRGHSGAGCEDFALGVISGGDPEIYDLSGAPEAFENEDAFVRHFDSELPAPGNPPRAYQPPVHPLLPDKYRVTCGIVPLDAFRGKAKEYGVSVTEFLAAVYMDVLQELWLSAPPSLRRRQRRFIVVNLPVNMRKLFRTDTNRNFSLVANVSQDMRLGPRAFADIAARAHYKLRYEADALNLGRDITRNVGASRSLWFRLIPLPVKKLLYRFFFSFFGSDLYSGSISNIGAISLPAWAACHVERIEFLPSPYTDKVNAGVMSWKDSIYINFGSLDVSSEIERLFFTRLRKMGLHVKIECNL